MGRRRMPNPPEVKVAVRSEVRGPTWFEVTAIAAIALLAVGMAALGWLGAPSLAP